MKTSLSASPRMLGLVRRAPGVGGEVDRVAPHGDGGDREHRERLDRVVVACMIAEGAFVLVVVEADMALDDDLGLGRDLERHRLGRHELDLAAAQEARELIFRERIRHRRHRRQDGAGIGADHGCGRQRLALLGRPAPMLLRPAPVREPAHQRPVAPRHLHPVDAEIVVVDARLARPPGHHQRPGDERRRLARPAGLDRQPAEVDVVAREHHLLHWPGADAARLHRVHRLEQRQHLDRLAPAARRLRLAQEGQHLADGAQLAGLAVHAPGDPLHGAEEVDQHRHVVAPAAVAHHVLEEHGRPLLGDEAGLDLRHLQMGGDRRRDPLEAVLAFEAGDEVAQRSIGHGHLGGWSAFMGRRRHPSSLHGRTAAAGGP